MGFITDPWRGKSSLNRVFWLYGLVGSLVYGALEALLNPENTWVMGAYTLGGILFSVYVAVATYRCANNCRSRFWARMARISAVLSLVLLPFLAYLEYTGRLSALLLGELGSVG